MVKDEGRVVLIVEGGGDGRNDLKVECRRGFNRLLERAGWSKRMPRIVAAGSRNNAYSVFAGMFEDLLTKRSRELPLLLVDSEGPVSTASPWAHVKGRTLDGWERPEGAEDDQLHLMVQCMEAWFLADREAMKAFFGKGFRENALPAATRHLETIPPAEVVQALARAAGGAAKEGYRKGAHSFKLLAVLDPAKIRAASPWAERFFSVVDRLAAPGASGP